MKLKATKSDISGSIQIPASKSHTIRAVAIASMANGTSILKNPLYSADALSCIEGIKEFGATVEQDEDMIIHGVKGKIQPACNKIDVGNSGTSLRILTGLASLSHEAIVFDGDNSIRSRPMMPLLSALENLGASYQSVDGKCPFTILGPIKGGKTQVNGISSQFLTSLLISCPLAERSTIIEVENLNEKPYVEITLEWLRRLGIKFRNEGLEYFEIPGNQIYESFERQIPADFSSATFAVCLAAIKNSKMIIKGLDFTDHQGDKEVFNYLKQMGLQMLFTSEGVEIRGGELKGIDIDMNSTPDALPAMAVTACFAKGTTRLLNVPQARLKECDRISGIATELSKMGAKIEELKDGLVIHQSHLKNAHLHGYDDHRMVMSLAIAGLATEGETIIDSAESIRITYPTFVEDLQALGANLEMLFD